MNPKSYLNIFARALVLTMFCAAFFHMVVIFIVAISTGSFAYLNPLSFLGLNTIVPCVEPSQKSLVFGWLALIALFFCMVWLLIHFTAVLAWAYGTKTYKHSLIAVEKLKLAQQQAKAQALRKQKQLSKKSVAPDKKETR